MRISSEVAAVTGASSGIGAELARQLAAQGVRVGLTARRAENLEAVAASIRAAGGTACVAPADASDPAAIREALAKIAGELGPIDLLVMNAGVGLKTPADDFSAREFDRMARVNFIGPAYAIEAVLPGMLARKRGHLVGISSLSAFRGIPGASAYAATKAGLSTLLESLRPELRGAGIAVTTVHPGFVRTAMTADQTNPKPLEMGPDQAARIILRGIAARRSRVDFPWPLVAALRMVRVLPDFLYDRLAGRIYLAHGSGRDDPPAEVQ
ncbi:SDR family NAD(P)-dependent oxidoreductase [Tundrisphaera sp. TA3]|uniref:SDR family NAD(P)-dependent oxidoreductase n=1 Tax=Tundrisphaera sp. TA3 TaxID=3435775 RepID=UPI003EBD468E